tara:strand:+ start:3131 stop:4135 length:1005 start_codon:yes stop_codon:yes gene_type:complete
MSTILLTGGFGYIGSHTASVLAEKNKDFVIYDNFLNSKHSVLERLESTIGKKIKFVNGDVNDTEKLIEILKKYQINSVIHFAALKSVRESIMNPIKYYEINVGGTISLINAMKKTNVKRLLFSSSATIYGDPEYLPIDENHPLRAINPYGQTKLIVENIIRDLVKVEKDWSITSLRYFNPIGAHHLGLIGDDPLSGKSENLMPSIIKVFKGIKLKLEVFGNDYDTKDGTGVRDYIHIMDLAEAHVVALDYLSNSYGHKIFNLGTGKGISVLELINTFEKVTNSKLPTTIKERRVGDAAFCYADPTKAKNILKWHAKRDLKDMCKSAYNFSKINE